MNTLINRYVFIFLYYDQILNLLFSLAHTMCKESVIVIVTIYVESCTEISILKTLKPKKVYLKLAKKILNQFYSELHDICILDKSRTYTQQNSFKMF